MEIVISIMSFGHIISASLSLVLGALLLFRNKGDAAHKKTGSWYFYAMLINNVTALFIFKARGAWFFPHWLAVVTLALIIPGYFATKMKNSGFGMKTHIICMVLSYYLLVGGAINEAFLHIESLRPLALRNDPAIGMSHFAAQIFFLSVLIYFTVKYRKLKMKPGVSN